MPWTPNPPPEPVRPPGSTGVVLPNPPPEPVRPPGAVGVVVPPPPRPRAGPAQGAGDVRPKAMPKRRVEVDPEEANKGVGKGTAKEESDTE